MKKITLIGSSIFKQWENPIMKNLTFNNLAVSGTTTSFWIDNMDQIIQSDTKYLAFYCGSNDINKECNETSIIERTETCFSLLKNINSKIKIAYFSIMKCPQKENYFELIDRINNYFEQSNDIDLFVDINSIINTDPKWYLDDRLHLQMKTYSEMEKHFSQTLENWI
jgi:hypothetical protein